MRHLQPSYAVAPRDWSKRSGVFGYGLRAHPLSVSVRHSAGSTDLSTFLEVFDDRIYELPAAAAAAVSVAPRVLDLGANAGYFSAFALAHWEPRRVAAWEPDAESYDLLRRLSTQTSVPFAAHHRAISNVKGVAWFAARGTSTSAFLRDGGLTDASTVEVPVDDFFDVVGEFDIVKMDIEGAEWAILRDARLSRVRAPVLVLEYHPLATSSTSPGEARRLLTDAGYRVISDSPVPNAPRGFGMVWALGTG